MILIQVITSTWSVRQLTQQQTDAVDTVSDYERGYYVPKPESAKQTTSTACDDENDENDEDQEVSPPARKRTTLEEPNDKLPGTKSSHHLHSNPLDDSILNKKIGKCISLACNSNLGHTILY